MVARKFYRPKTDDRYDDWRHIKRYDVNGFDVTQLWKGHHFGSTSDIALMSLFVSTGRQTDVLWNPLSLQIYSERLASLIHRIAAADVELFEAPLFDAKTNQSIQGFKLLNVVRLVRCLDRESSTITVRDDESLDIDGIYRVVLNSKLIPDDAHFFRLHEFPPALIMSQEVVEILYPSGVKGIAFSECELS